MNFITSILEQGLIYGILALGIYITYKILDFPDPFGPTMAVMSSPKFRGSRRNLHRTDPCEM